MLKLHDKLASKLGEKVKDNIDEFFRSTGPDDFDSKRVTGYCVIYSPLACVFIETDNEDCLERIFTGLHDIVTQPNRDGVLIENAWIPFQTEEVPARPSRAFSKWYIQQHPNNSALKELKTIPKVEDRIIQVYQGMVELGKMITDAETNNKKQDVFDRIFDKYTKERIPAVDELMSIAGSEIQTIKEYVEFRKIPDIYLEKE